MELTTSYKKKMLVKDLSNGPDWVMWVAFGVFLLLAIIFLSGHGANLIAGYNTSSKKEKSKYDEKKLCRVAGFGMLVITILIFILAVGEEVLPAVTVYIFMTIVIIDCIAMIILMNTLCKKK